MRKWREGNSDRVKDYSKRYRETNPDYKSRNREAQRRKYAEDPEYFRDKSLRQKYGITLDDYEAMTRAQGGVCAICGEVEKGGRALAVDHCHDTGQVRGLLCANCNRGIGLFQDQPDRLVSAAGYLARSEGVRLFVNDTAPEAIRAIEQWTPEGASPS